MDDPEDSLVEVQMIFSEIAFEVVPVTMKDPAAFSRAYRSPFVNE